MLFPPGLSCGINASQPNVFSVYETCTSSAARIGFARGYASYRRDRPGCEQLFQSDSLKFQNVYRSYHYSAAINVAEPDSKRECGPSISSSAATPPPLPQRMAGRPHRAMPRKNLAVQRLVKTRKDFVNVSVKNYAGAGAAPLLAARSVLTLPSGAPVEKWVEVKLSKRSKFASGLVARKHIVFYGAEQMVDSWDSTPASGTIAVSYASAIANANVRIASPELTAINVHSVNIWGFVSVSGDSSRSIGLGPYSLIGPFGTAAEFMDPNRLAPTSAHPSTL